MEALQQQTAVPIFEIRNLDLFYGQVQALKHIDMDILQNKITALIGPSGCGKSTFLRTLNRMNDLIEGVRVTAAPPAFAAYRRPRRSAPPSRPRPRA